MGRDMEFTLVGKEDVLRVLIKLEAEIGKKIEQAILIEAEQIATSAKANYVPVDFGVLKNSIHVSGVERIGKDVRAHIVAGGPAIDYAVVIHEYPDFQPPSWVGVKVKFSPSGRGPKYIWRPAVKAVAGMAGRIGKALDIEGMVR